MVKIAIFFQPWQITRWNKLLMKVHLMKSFKWLTEIETYEMSYSCSQITVAENLLANIEVTKSVSGVSPLCINHCCASSPHGDNDTRVKVFCWRVGEHRQLCWSEIFLSQVVLGQYMCTLWQNLAVLSYHK
jgi:hypothetical protein